jgi:hypothetical protein
MPNDDATAIIIPFAAPDDARGLHIARQLERELRRAGLGHTDAAADLRYALQARLGNPPLWDAVVGATEALVEWAWSQPLDATLNAEAAMDRAAAWMGETIPGGLGDPFEDDVLGVLYDGEWTSYCLRTGARLDGHPTAPDWLHELPME